MKCEPHNLADMLNLIDNGAHLLVQVKDGPFILTHPTRLGKTLFIPVSYDGVSWIERIGPHKKEKLSPLLKLTFVWASEKVELND